MKNSICVAVLAAALGSCTSANERVLPASVGTTRAIATTGSLRLVTERDRMGYPILCSEPSPDYAVAFDKAAKATVTVTSADGSSTSIAPDTSSVEDVTPGEGRAQAVLALRDGLHAACQSYANGLIGQDAYSIILSQYGNLLVALVGKQAVDAAGKPISTTTGTINPRHATLSALVVACISGNDPTRIPAAQNPLLNPRFCSGVLTRAVALAGQG